MRQQSLHFNSPTIVSSHPRLRVGKKFWNFQRQGGMKNFQRQGRNFLGGGYQIFLDQAGGTQNSDTKVILKIILISKVTSEIGFLNI